MRFKYSYWKLAKLFANSEDSDKTLHSVASDLGLYCLPLLLQCFKHISMQQNRFVQTLGRNYGEGLGCPNI